MVDRFYEVHFPLPGGLWRSLSSMPCGRKRAAKAAAERRGLTAYRVVLVTRKVAAEVKT